MLVHRTDLNHGDIAWQGTAAVQPLGFAQENGDIVRITALNAFADICSDEEALMEEYAVVLRIGVRCRTFGVQVMDMHIMQFTGIAAAAERIDENLRCTRNAAEMNVITGFNHLYSFIGRHKIDVSVVIHSFYVSDD